MSEHLLEVRHLKKYFPITAGLLNRTVGHVKAVDDISLTIQAGETFGLVGESGSGKSTVGRTILRLHEKTDGEVLFKGMPIHELSKAEMSKLRPQMQLIFQDPYSSLNPRIRIGDAVGEALVNHGLATKEEARERALDVLEACGLSSYHYSRFPTSSPVDSGSGLASPGRWR